MCPTCVLRALQNTAGFRAPRRTAEGLGAIPRPPRRMDDRLDDRVDAVERAITDGHAADGLPEAARMERRIDDLEATVGDLDDRVAELEAAVQALRGFAGGVRAVDEAVERRANAAVARVERLEADLAVDERNDPNRGGNGAARTAEAGAGSVASDGTTPGAADGADRRPEGAGASDRPRATRGDAALAEAAAEAASSVDTNPERELGAESDGSLADRIRRLL